MQNHALFKMDHWSFSSLKKSGCLERLLNYVTKPKPPRGGNDDQIKGSSNHEKVEKYIMSGFTTKDIGARTAGFIKMMLAGSDSFSVEKKISAIIDGVEIVGIPDLLMFYRRGGVECCTIIDFKLMKGNEDSRQLQTYAMIIKENHPEIQFFSGTFFYTELEFYDPIQGAYYKDFAGDIRKQYMAAIERCTGEICATPSYENCQYCDHPDLCSVAKNIEIPQIEDYQTAVAVAEKMAALKAVTGKAERLIKAYLEKTGVPFLALKKGKIMMVTAAPSMKTYKTAPTEAELKLLTSYAQAQRIEMATPVNEPEPGENNPQAETEKKSDAAPGQTETPVKETPVSEVKAEPCPFGDPEPESNEIPACPDCVHYDQEQGSGSTMGVICKKGHDMDCNGKDFEPDDEDGDRDLANAEPERNISADAYQNEQETGWFNKKTGFQIVMVNEPKGWIVRYKTDKGFSTIRKMSAHASDPAVALKLFVAAYEDSTEVEFRGSGADKPETIKEPVPDAAKDSEECNYCKRLGDCICTEPVSDELEAVVRTKFKRVFPGKDEDGFLQYRTEAADRAECYGFEENSNRVAGVVFKMLNVLIQNAND